MIVITGASDGLGLQLAKLYKKATGKPIDDPSKWMDPVDVATFMLNILDLPKNMEVSEVIINRK